MEELGVKISSFVTSVLLFLTALFSCTKTDGYDSFMRFARECGATEFYEKYEKIAKPDVSQYYHKYEQMFITSVYAMCSENEYSDAEFEKLVKYIDDEMSRNVDNTVFANDFDINGEAYDVYCLFADNVLINNKNFGFICLNDEHKTSLLCWFFDFEYDFIIEDEADFAEFFETDFVKCVKYV